MSPRHSVRKHRTIVALLAALLAQAEARADQQAEQPPDEPDVQPDVPVERTSSLSWVRLEGADADRVADAVRRCPTGALHYRRLDGGPQEEPEEELRVVPRQNGPLFLRGRIRVESADGELIREDTRVALCRCGGSQNKPFCDGTHRTNGFTA